MIHFIAILMSVLMVYANDHLQLTCFFPEYCHCEENDYIKIVYEIFRTTIYNIPLILGSYYCVFSLHGVPQNKYVRAFYILINMIFITLIVALSPKNEEFPFLLKNFVGVNFITIYYELCLKINGLNKKKI